MTDTTSGLDPMDRIDRLYANARLQLTFTAQSKAQARAWQQTLRERLIDLLGGLPAPADDLAPQLGPAAEFPGTYGGRSACRADRASGCPATC